MIVQVIDIMGEERQSRFSLQIPGGWEISNGCTRQWNAANNGSSQRYVGVRARQECYTLPQQLQSGCLFRFDWFKGADNPRMIYSKVPCPSQLVNITGCPRLD